MTYQRGAETPAKCVVSALSGERKRLQQLTARLRSGAAELVCQSAPTRLLEEDVRSLALDPFLLRDWSGRGDEL